MKLIDINISMMYDNADEVGAFLLAENPDIITLQEVLRGLEDSVVERCRSKENIEKLLGKNYPYNFFGPLQITDAFRKNGETFIDCGGNIEQGNEVITKFPIRSASNEFYYKKYAPALDRVQWKEEDHGRAVQIVEIDIKGKPLQVLNVHGIWTADKQGDERTIAECKYIIQAAKRKKLPTIIVGDFNLLPETESIQLMNKEFRNIINEYKITSTRPSFKDDTDEGSNVVDYIFVNDLIQVNDFKVIDIHISDHSPLALDFEIL